jgi:hypothetical protein
MKIADLDDVMLQRAQDGLLEFIEPIALEIVEQGNAELLLIRALDDSQIGLQDGLLMRLEIIEQVGLNRCGK